MKLLSAFLLLLALLFGCNSTPRHESPAPSQKLPLAQIAVPQFSAQRAFDDLLRQVNFGPRNPGSQGYKNCLSFFQTSLAQLADTVVVQRFSYRSFKGDPYLGNNVIARFNLFYKERILLTAHWDTRPWADQEKDKANHYKPIAGANDGASGVAVLLELSRIFKSHPVPVGIDVIFFDGEDVGQSGDSKSFCQGSQYFAKNLPAGAVYKYAINLDMVGDKNLEIKREESSDSYAPRLMDAVFSTARSLGISQFVDVRIGRIYDDHIALNEVNIPAIDLIDFDYPDATNSYWHTLEDTADKCSPESLEAVGTVLLNLIYGQRADY
jgi:hypothetical protein